MKRGALFFAAAATLSLSACLADQGKLEVRSIARGVTEGSQPIDFRVAEANGHLAIGNVALALEGFRKAQREDPQNIDSLAGMARCYDQMRRFDLSRRYYEQALAQAPQNVTLLALFASSLDQQGLATEAASVRGELAQLARARAAAQSIEQVAAADPAPKPASPALHEPAPLAAAPIGKSVTIALAPSTPPPAGPPKAPSLNVAPVGKSVTIALAPLPPAPPPSRQPRVERMSLTEVAIITGDGPHWIRPHVVSPAIRLAARKVTPQNERLEALPGKLRLLNAARVDRLAARTRTYLGRFGWRNIVVGDAAYVRSKSLILYPQSARVEAGRLANRFGFEMAARPDVRQLTILLGRDAAGHPGLRQGT